MPDWSTQCEAISRKTNERCPHRCRSQVPNILASHNVADGQQFAVYGRPVHLCAGHASHWWARLRRGLSVRLIEGGYLSAYNRHKYGSIVTTRERIDWDTARKLTVPQLWPAVSWTGRVPEHVARALRIEAVQAAKEE